MATQPTNEGILESSCGDTTVRKLADMEQSLFEAKERITFLEQEYRILVEQFAHTTTLLEKICNGG